MNSVEWTVRTTISSSNSDGNHCIYANALG